MISRIFSYNFRGFLAVAVAAIIPSAPASAQQPFTLETPAELSSTGDFNADGRTDVAFVDRQSGTLRVLNQAADGTFAAADTRSTGVPNPESMGVGKLLSNSRDTIAVTSAEWNRIHLIDTTGLQPVAAAQAGLGPSALAVLELPGAGNNASFDDLMVAGSLGAPPTPNNLGLVRATNSTTTVYQSMIPMNAKLSHGRRVLLKSGGTYYGGFMAAVTGGPEFRGYGLISNAFVPSVVATGVPAGADYAYGFFNGASPLAQYLFFVRGQNSLLMRSVTEPSPGVFAMTSQASFNLGAPIHLVSTVEHPSGTWLLVLFNGGASAKLYDFNGLTAPVQRQAFNAPAGQQFTAAAALGSGHFLLASGVGGRSASWRRQQFNGSTHVQSGSGNWTPANALSSASTVFLFDGEVFVNPNAKLTRLLKAGDWSNTVSYSGSTLSAGALRFVDGSSGLGSPFTAPLGTVGTGELAVPNQYQSAISLATLSTLSGVAQPMVQFSPAPGSYAAAALDPPAVFPVTLSSTHPSGSISYRLSPASAWLSYNGPISLTGNTVVEAYAGTPLVSTVSPITRASYTFTNQPALAAATDPDLDGDGLGDAWEKAFAITNPNGDSDGDGFTNRQEHDAGTDPRDPGSVPVGTGSLVLFIRLEPNGAGGERGVVYWPNTITGAGLQSSSDLASWLTITTGITQSGGFFEYRTASTGRKYYRLKR